MNQKWIKYLALSFALLLALGIISAIVNGSYALIKALGFLNHEIIRQEGDKLSQNFDGDLEILIIDISAGDILLQTGEKLMIQGNKPSSNLVAKFDNKTLSIQSNPDLTSAFGFLNRDQSPQITITLPSNLTLKSLELTIGAGQASLKDITTDELILKQGAGKIIATHVSAKKGRLDGGAGSISFKGSQLNDFEIDAGVGRIEMEGYLSGDIDINAGIGELYFEIRGNLNDYFITSDPGLGNIKANGQSIPNNGLGSSSSVNHIAINGGIGAVNLIFSLNAGGLLPFS